MSYEIVFEDEEFFIDDMVLAQAIVSEVDEDTGDSEFVGQIYFYKDGGSVIRHGDMTCAEWDGYIEPTENSARTIFSTWLIALGCNNDDEFQAREKFTKAAIPMRKVIEGAEEMLARRAAS